MGTGRSPPAVQVLAHRGAPAYLPDHTLEGYALAIDQGADVIEPDLVATKDGVLVCRHENELSTTTDVAGRFPDRRATKVIDGQTVTGWFTEDFTAAELRELWARQPLDDRPHDHDGRYRVPTFDEVLALVADKERATGRRIGIEPETKHPSYFQGLGLPLEPPLVAALRAHGYDGPDDVVIQSFESGNLQALRGRTRVRLLRLVDDDDAGRALLTPEGLAGLRAYADVIGVPKRLVIGDDGVATSLVDDAHRAGLAVHVWTFRPEARYVLPWAGGDLGAELARFYALGVDGVFCDAPDRAVAARAAR